MTRTSDSQRAYLLSVAVAVASDPGGWISLTRSSIAYAAGVSDGLVSHYLGSMSAIRQAVLDVAILDQIDSIILAAIADPNYIIPVRVRKRAAQSI